jgi:hypothetical protein
MFKKGMALGLATVAATAAFGAASAPAFTGISVGDPVFAVDDGNGISLGEIITCSSSLRGDIVTDAGPGNGGTGRVLGGEPTNADDFTDCNLGSAHGSYTTPWAITVDGAGNASISNIVASITTIGTCTYAGAITGSYDETTGEAVLSGNLTRTSGACFGGGASEPVSGTYVLTDQFGNPVQL